MDAVRSGTSGSHQVSRKPTRAIPLAATKTGCSDAAKASTNGAWSADGSWRITAGLATVGTCAPAGRRAASSSTSLLAKIAPNAETPIEPPTCRKSVEPEVATPRKR